MKSQYILYVEKHQNFLKNNYLKISAATWNENIKLPYGSFHVSFGYIIKKRDTVTNNPSIKIYEKIEKRI